jgi:hypothetical protein
VVTVEREPGRLDIDDGEADGVVVGERHGVIVRAGCNTARRPRRWATRCQLA